MSSIRYPRKQIKFNYPKTTNHSPVDHRGQIIQTKFSALEYKKDQEHAHQNEQVVESYTNKKFADTTRKSRHNYRNTFLSGQSNIQQMLQEGRLYSQRASQMETPLNKNDTQKNFKIKSLPKRTSAQMKSSLQVESRTIAAAETLTRGFGFNQKESTNNKKRLLSGQYLFNLKKGGTSLNVTCQNFQSEKQNDNEAHNSIRKIR